MAFAEEAGDAFMNAVMSRALDRLSFRRITDIPFETYVTALENWQHGGELHIGRGTLRRPIEHDRDSGTFRIEVRLARGPLRPPLRMKLNIDRWSWLPARTALELIPCERVWPTAAYFRAGHLLLDSLTRWVPQHTPTPRADYFPPFAFRDYPAGKADHEHPRVHHERPPG
jgi:hypothetical protein